MQLASFNRVVGGIWAVLVVVSVLIEHALPLLQGLLEVPETVRARLAKAPSVQRVFNERDASASSKAASKPTATPDATDDEGGEDGA